MNKTFWVQTLGCKVNQYEGEQIAALLTARGWSPAADPGHADLRVVNTCSVTNEAAAQSRQTARRMVRLPLLRSPATKTGESNAAAAQDLPPDDAEPLPPSPELSGKPSIRPPTWGGLDSPDAPSRNPRARVILTGCWATGDREAARSLAGVDAVLTHHDDVAAELDRLLATWREGDDDDTQAPPPSPADPQNETAAAVTNARPESPSPEPFGNDGWIIKAGTPGGAPDDAASKASARRNVNEFPPRLAAAVGRWGGEDVGMSDVRHTPHVPTSPHPNVQRPNVQRPGTTSLPLLGARQTGRRRAFLKVQDGCDAHCTYCIIPRLRPRLWSKPVADAVEEAKRLTDAGHVELVLTGIFLGAYGQPTALRRRQPDSAGHLGELVEALCTRVPGLRRLRLSSLEPGDLTDDLLAVLRAHAQVVPHFHLPLQSGSDATLRRMNRQYARDDFVRMTDRVRAAFDRPALTTDVIVAFPGETDAEFARTLEVVDHARFIHVHAFPFSPRPGTAAARWTRDRIPGPVARARIARLTGRAETYDYEFRKQFVGETVEVLIENPSGADADPSLRHGRSERYFPVWLDDPAGRLRPGDSVRARVTRVTPARTFGVA